MTLPCVLLLTSPDDYLLELERRDVEEAWREANPNGEATGVETAPAVHELIRELANPSLFSPDRLFVVRDAASYLAGRAGANADGEALGQALVALPLTGVTLVLAAVAADAPKGALAEAVRQRGEVRFLPVPSSKPWDEGKVTREQRAVLESKVLARVAKGLLDDREVVDALCVAYGFHPRELAQAAERLVLSGEPNASTVREQAGTAECSPQKIEDALIRRDANAFSRLFGALDAGGTLVDWRGGTIATDKEAGFLAFVLGRFLRQGLAARTHALRAGLERELDPRRCGEPNWYNKTFRARLLKALSAEIEATPNSPIAAMTAWQLHRAFRIGAAYTECELLDALGRLSSSGAERSRGAAAHAAVSLVVFRLISKVAA